MNWTQRRTRNARRRLALRALAGLAAATSGLVAFGLSLGSEQLVSEQAVLGQPPETVWRVLLDLDGMPLWRADLTAIERLPDLAGRPAWRERGRHGERILELATAEPPTRMVLRATRDGKPALPIRTFELAAVSRGTRVTVTERVLVRNPLQRVLYRLHPPRAGLTRFLRELEQRLTGGRREVVVAPD